jgi:HK97 gp10 family phage protein
MTLTYKSRLQQIARSLPAEVAPALRNVAEEIEVQAKERVPVDTGDLRAAIHVEDIDDGYAVVAGNHDVYYGHIVEHGSVKTPARPFLEPALESVRDNIDDLIRAALRDL